MTSIASPQFAAAPTHNVDNASATTNSNHNNANTNDNDHIDNTSNGDNPDNSTNADVIPPQLALDSPLPITDSTPQQETKPVVSSAIPDTNGGSNSNDNGDADHDTHDGDDDERPSKRRRVRDTTPDKPIRRPKVESPPWKKVEAEGPTTFIEDGKRRSGRTNALPVELQPRGTKRTTRGALSGPQSSSSQKDRRAGTGSGANPSQRTVSTPRASSTKALPPPIARSSTKKVAGSALRPSPRIRAPPTPSRPPATPPKRSLPTRRSSRTRRDSIDSPAHPSDLQETPNSSRPTRIRLRVKSLTVPVVHPAQVNVLPGQTVARSKTGLTFDEYIVQAPALDIREGGWLDLTDDVPQYTEEMAMKDARIILRVEREVEPGGLLSEGRSNLFAPDPMEEPPRQWAHLDHLVKQMANFRKLMAMEHQRHKATAKKLAEACREEWLSRQPKTAEEIEAEARTECMGRYRVIVKALVGTWDNVKTEINRRRLEEWEAAEQKRVKAALNEAVSMSELKLQARRARADSDALSDEDDEDIQSVDESEDEDGGDEMDVDSEEESSSDAEPIDNEDNMSSSDDDEDIKSTVSDEGLTQDQLRQKYANIPDLPTSMSDEKDAELNGDIERLQTDDPAETTDESVDMEDDITSSDEDSAEENDDTSEGEDSDETEEESTGLLGLLFGKKELKSLKQDVSREDEQSALGSPRKTVIEQTTTGDSGTSTIQSKTDGEIESHSAVESSDSRLVLGGPIQSDHPDKTSGAAGLNDDQFEAAVIPSSGVIAATSEAHLEKNPNEQDGELHKLHAPKDETKTTDNVEGIRRTIAESEDNIACTQPIVAVPSIETAPVLPDQQQPISEADVITNSTSRDRSQSPRTSETKPSDLDTASLTMKSGVSRSTTPPSQLPRTEVPFLLRGSLREYQHYGLDWLAGLYKNQTNGILADEMGLGKTIQTIALLAHLACHHEVWGPHLVIVPTSVMLNWEMEFKKWCPGFKVLSYYGSIEERRRKRQGWKTDDMWNVCVTSYQIVLQDQQVFKRRQWHYMILDEAHNIKNFKSKRWQTLLGFNTRARLLLTGTPLQNNLTELWSLLFFLMPSENGVGGFADLAEFQDWFHKPESQILESGREQMDDEARAIISKLHKVLRPYLLRRLKADVEKQMPAKYEHVELCRLSRRQRELYDGFLARTDTREALASGNYISVINCLMQLRKVCNHPDLFVERPIMTSFRQPRSVVAGFEATETILRTRFLSTYSTNTVSLGFLNLIPRQYENLSRTVCDQILELSSDKTLFELGEIQEARARNWEVKLNPSTAGSNVAYLDSKGRWNRLEELRHCAYVNGFRRQQRPIYGKRLTDFLTLGIDKSPFKSRPRVPQKIMSWFEEDSQFLRSTVPTLDQRAASMKAIISKFACVTPAVVTRDLDQFFLGSKETELLGDMNLTLSAPIRYAPFMPKEPPLDPWHESRMKLSIQFPDKRLLQYDCGKLQVLDRLLRKLQAGGHRALIFTQMTKVLDVLEQFLNIHGHKYLRLDGATKVEQRQILTDRFNHDPRILCFILSTRSGGLGINLTGADTVIFYDQDWNPAMDKQCQDRCHRIGQTRDVHIYRLVSEHTIEANILRKASQKQMLDDIVIQEGGFTTDYFNKLSVRDVIGVSSDEADVVGDAMDRVLGGVENSDRHTVGRVLEQAEDREDVAAAHIAEKEIQEDEADFAEKPTTTTPSGASSTRYGTPAIHDGHSETANSIEVAQEMENNAWGESMHTVDDYMLATIARQLEGTALEMPKDKKKSKSKKGKDTRKR